MQLGGMPGCGWYFAAPIHLVIVLAATGAVHVTQRLAGAGPPRTGVAIVALASPLLGHALLVREADEVKASQQLIDRCHGRVGDWLREHARGDPAVGADNIGYIGWRSGLRVVDMLGLVQPATADAIARGERDHALRTLRPELIAMWVGRGNAWKYAPDDAWFRANGYRVVFEAPLLDTRAQPAYTVFSRVEVAR
jgi:hypothetical protein